MDSTQGAMLGAKALKQVAKAIRDNERRMRNETTNPHAEQLYIPDYQVIWATDIPAATAPLTDPGTGTAYICQRDQTALVTELKQTTRQLNVINRTATSFTAGDYGKVQWNAGEWQPYGGGGGSQRIWFTIISVECVSATEMILTVEPTYFTGGCTTAIPGEDAYGYVIVEDVCEILLFYTAEWLVGKTGAATYMYPRTEYCTPLWLVDTICGTPECA